MISYRTAVSSDAEDLLRVRRNAVINNLTNKYPPAILKAWAPTIDHSSLRLEAEALTKPDRITLVAQDGTDIVGLCTLGVSEGLLKQCYVLPAYNGRGIARELLRQTEAIAKERGLKSLQLSSSLIALEFYKKQGYQELHPYEYELGEGLSMTCIMMEKIF